MPGDFSFGSSHFGTEIHFSGPMFDGRALRAVREYVDEIPEEIGDEGVKIIRSELGRVLKHPTGYYQSQIRATHAGAQVLIHDGRVVYGPWLEGTGSRNFPATRFRGYKTFERMFPVINATAEAKSELLLRLKYLRRME